MYNHDRRFIWQSHRVKDRKVHAGHLHAGELEDPGGAQPKKMEAAEQTRSQRWYQSKDEGFEAHWRLTGANLHWKAEEVRHVAKCYSHSSRTELCKNVHAFPFHSMRTTSLLVGAVNNQGGSSLLFSVIPRDTPQIYPDLSFVSVLGTSFSSQVDRSQLIVTRIHSKKRKNAVEKLMQLYASILQLKIDN